MSTRSIVSMVALGLLGCGRAARVDAGADASAVDASFVDASFVDGAVGAKSGDGGLAGASREGLEKLFVAHPEVTTLDAVPALFPRELRRSFVLKHGVGRKGERGHLVETRVSQSADPEAPRVIAWDETSGFVASYNGGAPKQTHGQRLDLMQFDATRKSFALEAIDFPIAPGNPRFESQGCDSCHGSHARPIFSMYPDWPGFYGSDNDELTRSTVPTQVAELSDFKKLRARVAGLPRYAPLFSESDVRERFERPMWETFPFRPDTRDDIHAVSRAFAYRPGLRLGILLARLQAQSLVSLVTKHPRYATLGPLFLSTLLECQLSPAALASAKGVVKRNLHEEPRTVGLALHERQAWKLFDLEMKDVDLRYAVGHEGNASDDASRNPMAIGYIETYWNSYFDGSATLDELVAYGLLVEEGRSHPELLGVVAPNGLRKKYEHLVERFRLDAAFFDAMDGLGKWIPIPYPDSLNAVHHREGFGKSYRDQHQALCTALGKILEPK